MKVYKVMTSVVVLGLLLAFSGSAGAFENPCNMDIESQVVKVVTFYGCTADELIQMPGVHIYNACDLNEEYTIVAGVE